MSRSTARGFTLIEVMIAIAIFAVMAALAYGGLSSILRTKAVLVEQQTQLQQVTRAFGQLEKDLQSALSRSVRNENAVSEPALLGDTRGFRVSSLSITAASNGARMSSVRVEHRFDGGRWIRRTKAALDAVPNTPGSEALLLVELADVQLNYFDEFGNALPIWPSANQQADPTFDADTLPKAVELRVNLPKVGTLRRLILLGNDLPTAERDVPPG